MISVIPALLTLCYTSLIDQSVLPFYHVWSFSRHNVACSYGRRMEICNTCPSISGEDLRAALAELKTYVDITEEDLMKIYVLAVRHARVRRSTMVPVQTVMTEKVVSATRDMSLHEAARLLSENKITGMPVISEDNRVIGVISEADILSPEGTKKKNAVNKLLRRLRGRPETMRPDAERVEDAMNTPPITTLPDADIKEVAAVLDMHRIKRLPVVDHDGRLVGIISRGDIIRAMGKSREA
jgi:CBS domain-containing membrane protein